MHFRNVTKYTEWSITSVMGVSITRLSPYFFHKPFVTCSNCSRIQVTRSTHFIITTIMITKMTMIIIADAHVINSARKAWAAAEHAATNKTSKYNRWPVPKFVSSGHRNGRNLTPSSRQTGQGDRKTDEKHHRGRERDRLPVPAGVHSTAKGERGFISKHIHCQLVRCNRYNSSSLYL